MKKLFLTMICLLLLFLTGCGTTVADIQKYEKENNVEMLKKAVNEIVQPKERPSVKDYHVEAVKALARMAPNNNDADSYIDINKRRLEGFSEIKDVVTPFIFRDYVRHMDNDDVRRIKENAEEASRYASSSDSEIVKEINAVLASCKEYENAEKRYDAVIKRCLGEFSSLDDLDRQIKATESAVSIAGGKLLRSCGADQMLAGGYTKEQFRYVVETSIALNPQVRMQYMLYENLFAECEKLKKQRKEVVFRQRQKEGWLKDEKELMSQRIKKMNDMMSGNTSALSESKPVQRSTDKDSAYGYISGSDVNVRTGASTKAEVIDCLDKGTKVEIMGRHGPEDGYIWYYVRLPNGKTGFVVSKYVNI